MDTSRPMFCLIFASLVLATAAATGTTPDIKNIFIGRCNSYVNDIRPVNDNLLFDKHWRKSLLNCTALYDTFMSAFADKDPCAIENDAFDPFVSALNQDLSVDVALFWSGTYFLAHRFALASTLKTMEDTFIGYLMNNLTFCGELNKGLNFSNCPGYGNCSNNGSEVMNTFWDTASKSFATRAKGEVAILLSGSNANGYAAYRNTSTFARIELPNLNPTCVRNVRIIVSHDIGKTNPKQETCNDGSLITLKTDLDNHGFKYTCEDDPPQLMLVQCSSNMCQPECFRLISGANEPIRMSVLLLLSFISLARKLY